MPSPLKLLLSSAAFFIYYVLPAQDKCICEEGEKLKPLIYQYADNGHIDSAFLVYRKIFNSIPSCQLLYYHGTSQLHMQKQAWDSARKALLEADELLKNSNCVPSIVSKHYSITGLFYTRINKLDSAQWAFLKAVEAAEKSDNKYALARALGDVAATVSKTKDYRTSIEYDKRSVTIAKTIADVPGVQLQAAKLVNLASAYGSLYEETGNQLFLDSMKLYGLEANATAKKGKDIKSILESFSILARYHFILKNYEQSNAYSDSIILKHIPGFTNYTNYLAWYNKAKIAEATNQLSLAAVFADSSQRYASFFNPQSEVNSLELIYHINKKLKNTSRSFAAFERMTMLKDSILDLQKNKTIAELEKKYNQAKNEKTINELAQEKRIYILLIAAVLLALIAIGFFIRQQSLKHKQTILETEQRLNRARMNPHFFFNALTALQSYAVRENDKKELVTNISRFSHIMRETLESTYREYVTIEQEIDFLNEYMQVQKIRLPQQFSFIITAAEDMETNELLIPSMIIQPFVENSIEHGFKDIQYDGVVTVGFSKRNREVVIHVSDNGIGFTEKTKDNGYISRASQIIKDRIYLLNIKLKSKARFSIENNKDGKGIFVEICLPELYKDQI